MHIAISTHTRFHMYDLARQMMRLGQNVSLYTGVPKFKIDNDLRPVASTRTRKVVMERLLSRIPVPRILSKNRSDRTLEDFGRWVARKIDAPDIVDALAGTGLEVGRLLSRRGVPWICNRASTHILEQKRLLDYEHDRWGVPRINFSAEGIERCLQEYDESSAIVVPSGFNKQSFPANGIKDEKVHVCPYGVNLDLFRPMKKEDDVFRVIFVGIACLRKGIGYLFDAIRPLVKSGRIECWMVGPVADDVEHIMQKNADLFIHHGVQKRSDLSWYYSQASVLVLPSIEEGLALVQAQAMACGVPVIATTNTGAVDMFTDHREGFIVPIRDPAAIQNRIECLLDNPDLLQEMKAKSIERVRDIGGWDQYGETCLRLYQALTS